MQIFVPVKSNLNANKMTAETTKSPLFCVGRQKNKNRVGLLRGPAGAPAGGKGFALYNLKYYTHKGNTMKLNFSETMRPTDTHNQSSSEVKLSLDEYYAIIYIAVCTVNGASSLIAIMGNFAALGAIWWTPSLHFPFTCFSFWACPVRFWARVVRATDFHYLLYSAHQYTMHMTGTCLDQRKQFLFLRQL